MDAVGMQYLCCGIWCSLCYLAGTVVTSFCSEVNAAVNGSIRKHSGSFIPLAWDWREYICDENIWMKQISNARETQNYQGFNMKNKCVILHVCISAETGSMSQWRENDVQPSSCYQHLWQTFHLSFTSHCLKPSFLHIFSCESEVWNISVLKNVFNCSFHVRANETVCAPGKWWKEWLYKSQRKPSPFPAPPTCMHTPCK